MHFHVNWEGKSTVPGLLVAYPLVKCEIRARLRLTDLLQHRLDHFVSHATATWHEVNWALEIPAEKWAAQKSWGEIQVVRVVGGSRYMYIYIYNMCVSSYLGLRPPRLTGNCGN